MPLPNVSISVSNGQLGRVVGTDDGVAGLIMSGTATGALALNTPAQLFSVEQLPSLGITEANNPLAYKDISAFYQQAGEGAELWIMLVSTATLVADMCDPAGEIAPKLLDAVSGRIRLLGFNRIPPGSYNPTVTVGIDPDIVEATEILYNLCTAYAGAYKPLRALLPGLLFTPAQILNLLNLKLSAFNRVAIILGADTTDGSAAMGLSLGRLAKIPVQRSIARVKDGAVGIPAAYFTDGSPVVDEEANWDYIHDRGYIFFRKIYGKSGFYFTDDPTATADSDDFSSIARGRVIDKATTIAYTTFVEELNEEIPVDPATGKVSAALIAAWQANVEHALGINMTAKGEIVKGECYINPDQNILVADQISIRIRITPVGYAKAIDITLGLSNPYQTAQ